MSKVITFSGPLSPYTQTFIKQKRASGYKYNDEENILYQFNQFCMERNFLDENMPREIVMEWLVRRHSEGANRSNRRASCIRQFAKYMISLGKEAYIPKNSASKPTKVPHIMTKEELKAFFFEVDQFVPDYRSNQRMAMAYSVMFRLYYCCGMRLSEVCKLHVSDMDLETGRITIYQSKGHINRIVLMSNDMLEMCRKYNQYVESVLPERIWFFPAFDETKPFHSSGMDAKFKYFWEKTPYAGNVDRDPTIHALRHTFVVDRINHWMRTDGDFQTLLPYLSRYLGHKTMDGTHYYYHLAISAFDIIKNRDTASANVIPEVLPYEE